MTFQLWNYANINNAKLAVEENMTVAPSHDYVSIGTLASQLRVTVREIERTAERLKLPAACRINYIVHFDGEQCEVLTKEIRNKGSK